MALVWISVCSCCVSSSERERILPPFIASVHAPPGRKRGESRRGRNKGGGEAPGIGTHSCRIRSVSDWNVPCPRRNIPSPQHPPGKSQRSTHVQQQQAGRRWRLFPAPIPSPPLRLNHHASRSFRPTSPPLPPSLHLLGPTGRPPPPRRRRAGVGRFGCSGAVGGIRPDRLCENSERSRHAIRRRRGGANVASLQRAVGRSRIRVFLVEVPIKSDSPTRLDLPSRQIRRIGRVEGMDDEDYSWVRRTRFSHSVVRSNSGREQFGAFVEQFNRGAALKQNKGSDSGFKLHGMNFEPGAKAPAAGNSAATPPIPRTRSLTAQPKTDLSSMQMNHEKPADHGRPSRSPPTNNSSNGMRGGANLFVDVCCEPEARDPSEGDSPGSLDFSFHPDEQSTRLQRVCSSPSPFPGKKAPVIEAPRPPPRRSSSLRVLPEARTTQMLRATSPLPSRPVPEVFKEAKSASKRFSTPPPPRRKSSSPPRGPPVDAPLKAPGKVKHHRKEHWDCERAAAAAEKVLEDWTVDRKHLLIGHKFASGAHSRLFHGIYMEMPVAVKFIRQPDDEQDAELASQLEKQFNTEIVTLSRLHHRNVIKLVGACTSPPVFCVITEFLSGGSLRAFLHRQEHRSLPLDKIISVGLDIAHGMGYIHSQGIVHRDVKPENIIFDGECCAKIVDFGIACEEAYCDPLANDPGTFRWMAPEMMKHKPYGRKVDVYSFGLILWEMLTGSVPYEDLTPFQAAFAVFDKNVRPAIPGTCPAALRVLIEQCWALQPDKRPEFWQIVQLLDKFKMVLERDGTLDNMPSSNCLESHDPKKWLAHWIHKLKHPHHHHDLSGPPPPKLL